jgi:hypothetical protein
MGRPGPGPLPASHHLPAAGRSVLGTSAPLGPVFHLDDPSAHILGQVVYSQGRCRHGTGVREFDDWTSVYVAAHKIPTPVLRRIARYTGVHL